MDDRAQSIGIARFFLGLIVGAVCLWIINKITSPLLNRAANQTSNATANTATTWLSDWIGWLPIAILLTSFLGLIVYSVFVRETTGR